MPTHSSTVAWKVPWIEEPGGLQSMGSLRVGHDWATSLSLFTFDALEKEMATQSSVLACRIPGTGEPAGLPSMGSHRVGHDWSDLAAAGRIKIVLEVTIVNDKSYHLQSASSPLDSITLGIFMISVGASQNKEWERQPIPSYKRGNWADTKLLPL